jgi:hypothetical protein
MFRGGLKHYKQRNSSYIVYILYMPHIINKHVDKILIKTLKIIESLLKYCRSKKIQIYPSDNLI